MAKENKPNLTSTTNNKRRKQRYLPHNKPVKKKGTYPLRPGVQGFFITCDGGRERQASHEAINVIDSFFEELVHGTDTSVQELAKIPVKPLNKKIKLTYSDDDDDQDEEENESEEEEQEEEAGNNNDGEKENKEVEEDKREVNKTDTCQSNKSADEKEMTEKLASVVENASDGDQTEGKTTDNDEANKDDKREPKEVEEPPAKKQCVETHAPIPVAPAKMEKSVDELIDDELKELGDKSKRRFSNLDSGCNGVVFVQMRPRDGDPSPKDIVQHMMTSAAMTRKHMSRFILRVLPIEVSCYASEEEITKAIAPIFEKYFPVDTQEPQKFAVIYDARANTGIDRMKIINAVAKSVPGPHKVDLNNPDKSIVVQVVKTVCLIGVVEKYKELAKYNLRQLTSPKP